MTAPKEPAFETNSENPFLDKYSHEFLIKAYIPNTNTKSNWTSLKNMYTLLLLFTFSQWGMELYRNNRFPEKWRFLAIRPKEWAIVAICLIFAFISSISMYLVERGAVKLVTNRRREPREIAIIEIVLLSIIGAVGVTLSVNFKARFFFGLFSCLYITVIFLKICSYVITCSGMRYAYINELKNPVNPKKSIQAIYPKNLTFLNTLQIMFHPTLIYIPQPKMKKFDLFGVLSSLTRLLGAMSLIARVAKDVYAPSLEQAWNALHKKDYNALSEHYVWIALCSVAIMYLAYEVFYVLLMKFISDLLCFETIDPICEWWSSDGVRDFWRKWNVPLTLFINRHMKKNVPFKKESKSKTHRRISLSNWGVFALSGLIHELLWYCATGTSHAIMFFTVLIQYPLIKQEKEVRRILSRLKISPEKQYLINSCTMWYNFYVLGFPVLGMIMYKLWWTAQVTR